VDVIGEGKLEELALPQAGARRWIDAVNHWGRLGPLAIREDLQPA